MSNNSLLSPLRTKGIKNEGYFQDILGVTNINLILFSFTLNMYTIVIIK